MGRWPLTTQWMVVLFWMEVITKMDKNWLNLGFIWMYWDCSESSQQYYSLILCKESVYIYIYTHIPQTTRPRLKFNCGFMNCCLSGWGTPQNILKNTTLYSYPPHRLNRGQHGKALPNDQFRRAHVTPWLWVPIMYNPLCISLLISSHYSWLQHDLNYYYHASIPMIIPIWI